jgi:hypothetical protein
MDKKSFNYIFQTISECNSYLKLALRNKKDKIVSVQFFNQAFYCIKQLQKLIYYNEIESAFFEPYYQHYLTLVQSSLDESTGDEIQIQEYKILKSKARDFENSLNFLIKQDITASENMFYI